MVSLRRYSVGWFMKAEKRGEHVLSRRDRKKV